MKIYNNLFPIITSPKTIFRAWEVFKSDKKNNFDVQKFEVNIERNIFKLCEDLKSNKYKHGPYKGFWIQDPKVRHIHKATVRDRVLHHAIFSIINPIFEPTFIDTSFSCRIGKGTHKGVTWVKNTINRLSQNNTKTVWVLKCDIKKFFDSVDHKILIDLLDAKIKDKKMMRLLKEIVNSYSSGQSDLFNRRGIPIGNLTSQIFANIYMNKFDQFVKQRLKVRYYARYTDDFVIISCDRNYLLNLLPKVSTFLNNELGLKLHPNKIHLNKFHQGIDFLGYVIFPYHIQLRSKTRKRIPRKIKNKIESFKLDKIDEKSLNLSFQSYLGVLSHSDSFNFTKELQNQCWFWLKE